MTTCKHDYSRSSRECAVRGIFAAQASDSEMPAKNAQPLKDKSFPVLIDTVEIHTQNRGSQKASKRNYGWPVEPDSGKHRSKAM